MAEKSPAPRRPARDSGSPPVNAPAGTTATATADDTPMPRKRPAGSGGLTDADATLAPAPPAPARDGSAGPSAAGPLTPAASGAGALEPRPARAPSHQIAAPPARAASAKTRPTVVYQTPPGVTMPSGPTATSGRRPIPLRAGSTMYLIGSSGATPSTMVPAASAIMPATIVRGDSRASRVSAVELPKKTPLVA